MVKFVFGLDSKYQALETKDVDTLYFATDTKKIYKGDIVVSDCNVAFTTTTPTVDNTKVGVLYVYTSPDGMVSLWINNSGSEVVQLGGGVTDFPQSDWGQTDPSAPDYIKNKTHGYDRVKDLDVECTMDVESTTSYDFGFATGYKGTLIYLDGTFPENSERILCRVDC